MILKSIKRGIPNAITCCNLLCGCFAILNGVMGDYDTAFWAIIVAAVFDFFDGFAARMLKAYSPIGGELDSLADMVSFGVAPAFIWFSVATSATSGGLFFPFWAFGAFLLAAFAALRLAKFNIDTRQSEEFRGLPTPAMALFIASTALTYNDFTPFNVWGWAIIIIVFCALMVCDIPMFSFKFKKFGFKTNALRYFFAIFAVLCIVLCGYAAPALIIFVYIIVSLLRFKSVK